jgi:hypothetical protein
MIEYREVTTRSTAAWKQPRQDWSLGKAKYAPAARRDEDVEKRRDSYAGDHDRLISCI